MVLLDSDILVGLVRGDEAALNKLKELKKQGIPFATTHFSEAELYYGVFKSDRWEENREKVSGLLGTMNIVSFEDTAPQIAARIFYELDKRGSPIGIIDVLIASVVLAGNDILVTRNKKHFEKIPGLEIEVW